MSHRICLCPESIAWIRKHLMKSARAQFRKMITKSSLPKIGRLRKSSRRRMFSPKQLAAQRLFAKRAKAGTLRRRR